MKKKYTVTILIGLILLISLLHWGNTSISITEHTISNAKIPAAFSNVRIVQVSDVHNDSFGMEQRILLERLEECKPDLIVITGDLIDSSRTHVDPAMDFIEGAIKMAPVYYVPGNHEARVPEDYHELKTRMESVGVQVLENRSIAIKRGEEFIYLMGVMDPLFTEGVNMEGNLRAIDTDGSRFRVLLSHRPEYFSLYVEANQDLVLTGHAHGGQIRVPFLGGLLAPGQGLLPTYTEGLYTEGETTMGVSRGIGNSLFPLRVNNRPELVVYTLNATE